MLEYKVHTGGKVIVVRSYDDAKNQLDAIFASGRLRLPFKGVLLFGYEVLISGTLSAGGADLLRG
jgi:hypothetical protein